MKSIRSLLLSAALLLLVAAVVVPACSKKSNKVTNPGGGGGGLELNSGNIVASATFDHTFNTAGTFPYHCTIHSAMTGNSITVDPNSTVSSVNVSIVSSTAPGFSPSAATIMVGGTVHWTNNTGTTHTVTSGS
jgi:plastocyanin